MVTLTLALVMRGTPIVLRGSPGGEVGTVLPEAGQD